MIKALSITNFQCHKRKVINLDPRVTVIVGGNGTGKSALFRAARWCAFNEWQGKAGEFTTWTQESTSVKLWRGAVCVERYKSQTDNGYKINDKTVKFDTVDRRTPPLIVATTLGLTPDNFQGQLDTAYWLSLTPGQAAKSLNRIVNLEAIDQSLANIAVELREVRMREKVSAERLEQARNIKESLDWVVEADAKLCTLEQLEANMADKASRIASAERTALAIGTLDRVRDHAEALAKQGQIALAAHQKADRAGRRLRAAEQLAERISQLEGRKCRLQKDLNQKQTLLTRLIGTGPCPVCGRTEPTTSPESSVVTGTSPKGRPSPAAPNPTGSPRSTG